MKHRSPAPLPLLISTLALAWLAMRPADAPAAPFEPLELQIVQRPPYLMVQADGTISGIAVKPTLDAFRKAGIEVFWKEVPAVRQMVRLKANQERVCSVGWYKTPERLRFTKFSSPVSHDSPWAGFAGPQIRLPRDITVRALLADPRVTVLLKTGFVYGDYLDREISTMRARRQETHADMPQVLKMIEVGRAQITFAPIEEIQYYLRHYANSDTESMVIPFRDMPPGYARHLMCSKRVEDQLIARFNAALVAAPGQRKPAN
ncbi:substrate-binding periplasmic protein [Duganella sp. PWIR1]